MNDDREYVWAPAERLVVVWSLAEWWQKQALFTWPDLELSRRKRLHDLQVEREGKNSWWKDSW